jgi:hypothetical protein
MTNAYKIPEDSAALSSYLDNCVSNQHPFYTTSLINNLEALLSTSPAKGEGDVLERIFSDKTKTLKSTAKALLDEIKLREYLKGLMINKIDCEISRQNTEILQLPKQKSQYDLNGFVDIEKLTLKLEDRVLDLEKEKRKEYVECWRDLMFLKKYLLSSLKDYWDLVKRRDLLSSESTQNEGRERYS